MGETVQLTVQSDLGRIISDLQGLQKKAAGAGDQLKRIGTELDTNLQRNTKRTEQHFEKLRDLGRRMADQLRGYFTTLSKDSAYALEGLKRDLGLRQQFKDATVGAVELHDTIRKIGGSLDIASNRLIDFQSNLTKAFSRAGFDTNAAGRALQGIAGTQVSGEASTSAYALKAAKLAQAGGQEGQEGDIANLMASILQRRGIDQNDLKQMDMLGDSVRGRNPREKLQGQLETYSAMDPNQRKAYGPEAMKSFAAVRKEVGPELDSFIKEMTQGWLAKLPKTAQGLGGIVTANGIDFKALTKAMPLISRLGQDVDASGATLGLSPEASRGMFALGAHARAAAAAQERARAGGGSLDADVQDTRGLGENAAAVKNRVGGMIGNAVTPAVGIASEVLGKASKTDVGSILTMGAGFAGAALAAGGLTKLGSVLGKKMGGAGAFAEAGSRAAALEQLTGQKTIPVYVVNVGEFAHLGGAGQLGGDVASKLGSSAAGGAAAAAMTAALAAAIPVALAAAGAYSAYQVEQQDAGKPLSRNDLHEGAKNGSIALLIDLVRQITNRIDRGSDASKERNEMQKRARLDKDAPVSNRGSSFANTRREP